MDIPLSPVPDEEWQNQFDELMKDEYLRSKYNRRRSILEHIEFFRRYCPGFFDGPVGRLMVDIGPGFGCGMEVAAASGWNAIGVETDHGYGGMGNAYLQLARLMHRRQNLAVTYEGWQDWIRKGYKKGRTPPPGDVHLFVSRGSWEQCYREYLIGPPHHEHHDASRLRWWPCVALVEQWREAFELMEYCLAEGGYVLIHGNGTDGRANEHWYSTTMCEVAEDAGLVLNFQEGTRLHRWIKQ